MFFKKKLWARHLSNSHLCKKNELISVIIENNPVQRQLIKSIVKIKISKFNTTMITL